MASLAKWLSVGLLTKWLWIRITLLSLKLQIWRLLWARISSTFRQTIECRFTLKLVRDMIITYSQMHRTDKYSQHSLIIWPVWSVRLRTKWLWVRITLMSLLYNFHGVNNNSTIGKTSQRSKTKRWRRSFCRLFVFFPFISRRPTFTSWIVE